MSLSVGTPAPRRRAAAPRKGAAKKPAPRPAPKAAAPRMNAAPGLVDAERLFRRFEQQLADGEHPFSVLRQGFSEWCEAGDLAPPSDIALAAWLRSAGLHSYRTGRAKITIYAKRAARLAA
jgi:hypothetical protein